MKRLDLFPLVLLTVLTLALPLGAQTVHQFKSISVLADRSISLRLDGSVNVELFGSYFDQYIIEASTNLIDWFPLVTLQQTNQPTTTLTYHDKAAAQFEGRFYRTLTNHFITPVPLPTGPYAVGSFSRLLTDSSRTNEVRGVRICAFSSAVLHHDLRKECLRLV